MAKIRTSDTLATAEGGAPATTLSGWLSQLVLWRWRLRYRRELSTLTEEQMSDTGLDPVAVRREAKKPFWEA